MARGISTSGRTAATAASQILRASSRRVELTNYPRQESNLPPLSGDSSNLPKGARQTTHPSTLAPGVGSPHSALADAVPETLSGWRASAFQVGAASLFMNCSQLPAFVNESSTSGDAGGLVSQRKTGDSTCCC